MAKPKRPPTQKPAQRSAQPPAVAAPPRRKRPPGRARVNLMVDRDLLNRVATRFGTTNKSAVVHALLTKAEEDDAIMEGIDAMFGAYPNIPLDDAP